MELLVLVSVHNTICQETTTSQQAKVTKQKHSSINQ